MKKISIIGCGWLGLQLAKKIKDQYNVIGTTTRDSRLADIEPFLQKALLFNIYEQKKFNKWDELLNVNVVFLNIPPRARKEENPHYLSATSAFLDKLNSINQNIDQVVFVSSTSVYGANQGKVEETDICMPTTKSGEILLKVEELVQDIFKDKTAVLRPGGLIGGERKPGAFLAQKKNLDNPKGPVNLIHREDLIHIILKVLERRSTGIYNAVCDDHPSREDFYIKAARNLGLELPEFINKNNSTKCVLNGKLKTDLDYKFKRSLI